MADAGGRPPLEFRILGPLEVLDGSRRIGLPAGRARALLALLVLHAGEVVSAGRLVDELWGERPPATAATVVQGFVSRLRRDLEPGRRGGEQWAVLRTEGAGYLLAVEPDAVDANRFKRLVDQARAEPAEARSALLADALALWRGPPLADFTYQPFAQRAITALEEARLIAIEERVDADLAIGRHADLVAELDQLVAAHPFRERLHGLLMLALYRAGRQAEALAVYRRVRARLVDELGVEPTLELRRLESAILHHDRSLDAPALRTPLLPASSRWLPRERRTVTVLAVDLTAVVEAVADPEALESMAGSAVAAATEVLRRHGARVEPARGELLPAFFGLPVSHEDDAVRAVRAALELCAAEETKAAKLGLDTGEVLVGGASGAVATGPVVSAAARLARAAPDHVVVVGQATRHLVRGSVVLKSAGDLWHAVGLVPGAPVVPRHLDAPLCGRAAELTQVRAAFRRAVRTGRGSRLTVLGEAGVGKSRLAQEFVASLGTTAKVITGRCPPYGEGITFLPLREALLEAAGPAGLHSLLDGHNPVVAGAIGLTPQRGGSGELFPAVRHVLESLAADRPLVVLFDDLHWAEWTLLDLVEYTAEHAERPVFLFGLARPELAESRPAWVGSGPTLMLDPLPAGDVRELLARQAGPMAAAETLDRIERTAQGNPLFAEQLLAALADHESDDIPASLRGLLAARLDRLGPGERDLLRCASVVGADCDGDALVALAPTEARSFLGRHIETLEHKRLIQRPSGTGLRFSHVLIQLAAYRSMAREDRAGLHERYADWLDAAPQPPPELDELVGYHLEHAVLHRRATGTPQGTSSLAVRAGERLARAADRALGRFDMTAAGNLLVRSRTLLPEEHPARMTLTQRLAEAELVVGHFAQAQDLLRELADAARARGDTTAEWSARLELARVQCIIGPDPVTLDALRHEAGQAAAHYSSTTDTAGQGRAMFLIGITHLRTGQLSAAARAFETSLRRADQAGDAREELASRWMLAQALRLGPVPLATCVSRCTELSVVRGTEHPGVLTELAILRAMAGDVDHARELSERARRGFVERIRVRRLLMFLAEANAEVALLAGDPGTAERELRAALDHANTTNEPEHIARDSARLALILLGDGRQEGVDLAVRAARIVPAEAGGIQALVSAAAARAASNAGDHPQAERLARQAVRLAPSEMLALRADVLLELAEVLRAAGDEGQSKVAGDEAARLRQVKGLRLVRG